MQVGSFQDSNITLYVHYEDNQTIITIRQGQDTDRLQVEANIFGVIPHETIRSLGEELIRAANVIRGIS